MHIKEIYSKWWGYLQFQYAQGIPGPSHSQKGEELFYGRKLEKEMYPYG
jgi:hypothetical protein